ncbi:Transcriptional regulator, MarR family [Clostridiaceae bacterium JG1575]|nr:Transcriptional regulator, MarR family [Clostridiaceae bacterium JG1575]
MIYHDEKITAQLFDLMVILHKRIFNPLAISKTVNLTPAQISILYYLMHRDRSSVTEVAEYLHISKPNMTPVLDSLSEMGYIVRERDTQDRRVIHLLITEEGRTFYEVLKRANQRSVETLFMDLPEEQWDALNHHSEALLQILGTVSPLLRGPHRP